MEAEEQWHTAQRRGVEARQIQECPQILRELQWLVALVLLHSKAPVG